MKRFETHFRTSVDIKGGRIIDRGHYRLIEVCRRSNKDNR